MKPKMSIFLYIHLKTMISQPVTNMLAKFKKFPRTIDSNHWCFSRGKYFE